MFWAATENTDTAKGAGASSLQEKETRFYCAHRPIQQGGDLIYRDTEKKDKARTSK
jgi:hypothetical protein